MDSCFHKWGMQLQQFVLCDNLLYLALAQWSCKSMYRNARVQGIVIFCSEQHLFSRQQLAPPDFWCSNNSGKQQCWTHKGDKTVQFGIEVASYLIGSDLSVMQHENMTAASQSAVFCLLFHPFPTAEPYRSWLWRKRLWKWTFFQTRKKKKESAMRGTKLLHVCVRAGLDSITQQQGNIRAELWLEEWNKSNYIFHLR